MRNEEVFFKLIHNTYDESKRQTELCMKHIPVTAIFKDVFGQHLNKKNLKIFFAAEAVQYIWENVYCHTKEFKHW